MATKGSRSKKKGARPAAAAPSKKKKVPAKKPVRKKAPSSKRSSSREKASEKTPAIFPVVAIGASAGGLEAIAEFLENLSPNLGMAYIVIQHLSPDHKSILPELLERRTAMPVHKVIDKMHIEPNKIYVIPAHAFMSITDGKLRLHPRFKIEGASHPIDFFLNALAPLYQNKAIAIIFSGTATDGTDGVQSIKAAGGITFAQDDTARFTGMPRSAYQSGAVDFVMSPKAIATELALIVRNSYSLITSKELSLNENELRKIQQILHNEKGVDFNHYKRSTIHRRIARRVALNKLKKLEDYTRMLRQKPEEVDLLYKDLLINVTSFFREPAVFETLSRSILPNLLKSKKDNEPLRIWVPACATGEEACSIAICLFEYLKNKAISTPIQIFATDLSETTIEKARTGIYSTAALQNVSAQRLKRFFVKTDGYYQIIKPIRDICIFATHNLLGDPPFSRIDLISCQNVMIYLEPNPQKKILYSFHYALNNTGYLLLGKSETIGDNSDLFKPLYKDLKIYSKKASPAHPQFEFVIRSPASTHKNVPGGKGIPALPVSGMDIEKEADKLLLAKYIPSSVLINSDLQILRFHGITSQYLQPAAGKASLNLLKMVRDDLVIPLRSLIQQAKKQGQAVRKQNIVLHVNGRMQEIGLEVAPIPGAAKDNYFLVIFRDEPLSVSSGTKTAATGAKKMSSGDRHIQVMAQELKDAREQMKSMSEEFEAVREELQSANEEVLSSNEELQSINEELETSKEELQSTNEELTTINEEVQRRNNELKDAINYTESIVETIREPLLVLSMDLKIQKANKAFYSQFGVRPDNTLKRFFYEVDNGIWKIPVLQEQLAEIIHKGKSFRDFELVLPFENRDERILLFNAMRMAQEGNKADLLLLVIEDITERRRSEERLKQNADTFRLLVQNAFDIITIIARDGTIQYESESVERGLGYRPEERVGRNIFTDPIVHPADLALKERAFRDALKNKNGSKAEFRLRHKDGTYRIIDASFINLLDDHRIAGIVATYHDVTENKRLENQKEEFIGIASHELKTPVTSIKGYVQILHQTFQEKQDAETLDILGKTIKQVNRLNDLIRDLLDVTRIREGQLKFRESVFDINDLIAETTREIHQIYKKHQFITDLKASHAVYGDRERITQVLTNLLNNAVKYSPGQQKVIIRSNSDPDKVTVSIKDEGVGIDKSLHAKIFERFFRVNDIAASTSSGIGLGLYLCREIITRHGGSIWVKSSKTKGATFFFTLPVRS